MFQDIPPPIYSRPELGVHIPGPAVKRKGSEAGLEEASPAEEVEPVEFHGKYSCTFVHYSARLLSCRHVCTLFYCAFVN